VNIGALLALLWLRMKVKEEDKDPDPCSGMTPGSPAHIQCLIENK